MPAKPTKPDTIVLVHGFWVTPRSWEGWIARYEALGYRVIAAVDGSEALQRCTSEVTLVLTDVVMPAMSGKELVEHLTRRMPALRVLYMSGYAANAIVDRGVLEAGTQLLHKPFTPVELARKVRAVLDG